MPVSKNIEAYKRIYAAKGGKLSLNALCDNEGVNYQSYNNWAKKQDGHKPTKPASNSQVVTVARVVSIKDVASLVLSGKKTLAAEPIALDALLKNMNHEHKRALAEEIGLRHLDRMAGAGEAEISED